MLMLKDVCAAVSVPTLFRLFSMVHVFCLLNIVLLKTSVVTTSDGDQEDPTIVSCSVLAFLEKAQFTCASQGCSTR